METRSGQIFDSQKISVEAHVEDNWGGVKLPIPPVESRSPEAYTDIRSTENAMQTELVLHA